jgi:hypothetical protein
LRAKGLEAKAAGERARPEASNSSGTWGMRQGVGQQAWQPDKPISCRGKLGISRGSSPMMQVARCGSGPTAHLKHEGPVLAWRITATAK